MTVGSMVFWLTFVSLSLASSVAIYPGLRPRLATRRHRVLAAVTSSTLFAAFVALAMGVIVNAIVVMWTGSP